MKKIRIITLILGIYSGCSADQKVSQVILDFQEQAVLDTKITQSLVEPYGLKVVNFCYAIDQQSLSKQAESDHANNDLDSTVTQTVIPNHVAIIPDGNRRWSKDEKIPLIKGLRKSTLGTVPMITEFMWRAGVHTVSIWCFSTENWQRSIAEVCDVMQVITEGIEQALLPLCLRMQAKIVHLGRRDRLPSYVLQSLDYAIDQTKTLSRHIINLCIDHGGQDEICRVIENLEVRGMLNEGITPELCSTLLDTAHQKYPIPDLIIRTSGEKRLSGFFLWQSAYSEFYFFKKRFPDLTNADIRKALDDYAQRQRRYGK